MVASTGKRSAQQLTGVDGEVIALDGNGWVIVRTSDGSETLRIQQRYLSKQPKEHDQEVTFFSERVTQRNGVENATRICCIVTASEPNCCALWQVGMQEHNGSSAPANTGDLNENTAHHMPFVRCACTLKWTRI